MSLESIQRAWWGWWCERAGERAWARTREERTREERTRETHLALFSNPVGPSLDEEV
jgi:hypothetical protein